MTTFAPFLTVFDNFFAKMTSNFSFRNLLDSCILQHYFQLRILNKSGITRKKILMYRIFSYICAPLLLCDMMTIKNIIL